LASEFATLGTLESTEGVFGTIAWSAGTGDAVAQALNIAAAKAANDQTWNRADRFFVIFNLKPSLGASCERLDRDHPKRTCVRHPLIRPEPTGPH
jgi:hypothetical protein